MREITTHRINPANDRIQINVLDEPGSGGANHRYELIPVDPEGRVTNEFTVVHLDFQNGPIATAGVNGITHEVLLAILIDRLECFQAGPYNCEENFQALHHLRSAVMHLKSRTLARMARGVEGTHTI